MSNGFAIALILILVNALWPKPRPFPKEFQTMDGTDRDAEERVELSVTGMRCNGCVESVTRALNECEGVDDASVDLAGGRAVVRGSGFDRSAIAAAVRSLGFEVEVGEPARPAESHGG